MSLGDLKNASKVVGTKQVKKSIVRKMVKIVYIASDAEPHITEAIIELCKQNQVEYEMVGTMKSLGEACGIEVGSATVALLGS